MRIDLLIVAAAFLAGWLVAEAAGAVNTGTALSFGQIAFVLAVVGVIVRR